LVSGPSHGTYLEKNKHFLLKKYLKCFCSYEPWVSCCYVGGCWAISLFLDWEDFPFEWENNPL
jgi:hypothetical protein